MQTLSSPAASPVRIHLSDEAFTVRLSYMDAYVLPASADPTSSSSSASSPVGLFFPCATLVSSHTPRSTTVAPSEASPSPAPSGPSGAAPKTDRAAGHHEAHGATDALAQETPLQHALLAWQCPLCGSVDAEKLAWIDQSLPSSFGAASSSSSSSLTTATTTDRRMAKLMARKLAKTQQLRRSLAVPRLCTQCHLCPRCGGGGGLAMRLDGASSRACTTGTPTVGLQTRMTPDMHYGAVCAYCQWSSFCSFEEMGGLTRYLQAMSPAQAPVLRSWRRAQRELLDRLVKHPNFFVEGEESRGGGEGAGGGLSYSRAAWEQFLRVERARRRAMAADKATHSAGPSLQRTAAAAAPLLGGHATPTSAGEADVYAAAARGAASTHRAVVLEALRACCRRMHEAQHYNPTSEAAAVVAASTTDHTALRPSYAHFTPLASVMAAVEARMKSHADATSHKTPTEVEAEGQQKPPLDTAEAALVARTQQAQLGLEHENVAHPHFTAETVAALLRPGVGLTTTTAAGSLRGRLGSPSAGLTRAPLSPAPPAQVLSTPTPPGRGTVAGEASTSRLNALPSHLETFLAEQSALEAHQGAASAASSAADGTAPWLSSLMAFFITPPNKTPLTALCVEASVPVAGLRASASAAEADERLRVVSLLGVAANADPRIASVVEYWAAVLMTRFSESRAAARTDDKTRKEEGDDDDDDDDDDDEDETAFIGTTGSAEKPSTAAAIALTSSARTRRALPLLLPLRRSAVCLLPHLQYLSTTCAFSQASAATPGRRVIHQVRFHLVNLGAHEVLVQRISLARCSGFPSGSRVGLWTTADTAAHDASAAEGEEAEEEEWCAYVIDEVKSEPGGVWRPCGAATSSARTVPPRGPGQRPEVPMEEMLKGWCRLAPAHDMDADVTSTASHTTCTTVESAEAPVSAKATLFRQGAPAVFERVRATTSAAVAGPEVAPTLPTTAPRLSSLPLTFTLNTPVPSDGSLTAFSSTTSGPPPCFIGIRVEALVYLPAPLMPESAQAVWRAHVRPEDRAKLYGYHRVVFGLCICT